MKAKLFVNKRGDFRNQIHLAMDREIARERKKKK